MFSLQPHHLVSQLDLQGETLHREAKFELFLGLNLLE